MKETENMNREELIAEIKRLREQPKVTIDDYDKVETVHVEMNVIRDAMSIWTGAVPKKLFQSENPKFTIAQWLWENGVESEIDYDNIIIDSFDYDRDAVDGVDVKGDY